MRKNLNETGIIDLSQKREDRKLQKYHGDLRTELQDRMKRRAEQIGLAKENGIFDGFNIGERIRTQKGTVFKVIGFGLTPIMSPKVEKQKRDFFQRMGWGEPLFVRFDDELFEPVIHVENDDEKGSLIVAALRKTGWTPLRGPRRVSESKEPITLEYLKQIYENPKTCAAAEKNMNGSYLCQRVADMVMKREGVDRTKIYSFNPQHNPEATYFAQDEDDEDGHVFAVVADRYIVDPWVYGVYIDYPKTNSRTVFDLKDQNDAEIIRYFYGKPSNWYRESGLNDPGDDASWPV